jgi:hypothetical protein
MEASALKVDLIDKIEHANDDQVREIYGLVTNYFNGQDEDGWDSVPELHQKLILKGLEQANAGLTTPAKEVTARLRAKYGLNG